MPMPNIENIVPDICSIRQAVEYMKLDIFPLNFSNESISQLNSDDIIEALMVLKILLQQHKISATGIKDKDCVKRSKVYSAVCLKEHTYQDDGIREKIFVDKNDDLFWEYNCIGKKHMQIKWPPVIDGYRDVEINFQELMNVCSLQYSELDCQDRRKLIKETAIKLPDNIKTRPDAIRAIQQKLNKTNIDVGYSYGTISGIIKNIKNSDGSYRFKVAPQGNYKKKTH